MSLKDSHKVFVSDETWRWIRGFLPVARKVMAEPNLSERDLAKLAIWQGLDQMLTDAIPKDSNVLLESFKHMTIENPKDVGAFIVQKMDEGKLKELKDKWRRVGCV
jgi:hypothetical protein